MISESEIIINGGIFKEIEVKLPKTTLLIITNDKGFVMCGALNVAIYQSDKLKTRRVLCANALGVHNFDELLKAKVNDLTEAFESLGAYKGMRIRDALALLNEA